MHAANIKLSGEDPEYFAEYKIVDIASETARLAPGVSHRACSTSARVWAIRCRSSRAICPGRA